MKTRAAVLYELNKPLRIQELTLPELKTGQVLAKVHFSGVCHSQLMEVRGNRGPDTNLPHLLGHEASGIVVGVGEGLTKVKVGDRVILGWIKGKGLDVVGPKYQKDGLTINAGAITTFSDYTIVSENRCVKLPRGIPLDSAVLFGCAIPTGVGMVVNHIKPKKGATLAIFGMGGIGLSALMATTLYQLSTVIAVDIEDYKLELAREFGATHIINATRQSPLDEISNITGGKGVDYSIETSGCAKSIEVAFHSIRKFGGFLVFASHPRFGDKIELDPHDLISGKRIEGNWGGSSQPDRDIPKMAQLYRKGRLPLQKLLGRRYTLDEINEALDDLEKRRIVRPLIIMDQGESPFGERLESGRE